MFVQKTVQRGGGETQDGGWFIAKDNHERWVRLSDLKLKYMRFAQSIEKDDPREAKRPRPG